MPAKPSWGWWWLQKPDHEPPKAIAERRVRFRSCPAASWPSTVHSSRYPPGGAAISKRPFPPAATSVEATFSCGIVKLCSVVPRLSSVTIGAPPRLNRNWSGIEAEVRYYDGYFGVASPSAAEHRNRESRDCLSSREALVPRGYAGQRCHLGPTSLNSRAPVPVWCSSGAF
jgi:hypothetical protein